MLRDNHLKIMKYLGYDTYSNTYEDIVAQILDDLQELRIRLKEEERERFLREIERLKKPTN